MLLLHRTLRGGRRAVLLLLLTALPAAAAAERASFAPAGEPIHDMPERGYDLRHLRLDLTFDWDKREVAGTATNILAPLRPGLDHLVFHAADMMVQRVRLAGDAGEAGDYRDLPFDLDPKAETLTVDLGSAHGPGEVLEVAIDYRAHPRAGLFFVAPDRAAPGRPRQIYSLGEPDLNRHWFPSWDAPNDRATSELLATVPRPYQVIGNGRLLETVDHPDGSRTFHWRMDQPHPTYLVSVVVADLARIDDSWQGVPVEYWVPPGHEAEGRATFGHTPDMMSFFTELTGVRYPYPRYSQAAVFELGLGGMENVTATTVTDRLLHTPREALESLADLVISHELAHQWFGNLVSFAGWEHTWLSEGFAEYLSALYLAHAEGGDDRLAVAIADIRAGYLAEDATNYRRPLVTRRYTSPSRMLDEQAYDRGALVLHMIHHLLGEEAWRRGLHEYLTRFAGQTATTADLQETLEQVSGVPLGPLFDQYVYGAGHPELKMHWDWRPGERQVRLTVEQTQRVTAETGYFSFPVEVALSGGAGTEVRRVTLEPRRLQEIVIPAASRPRTVVFDPGGWMLKTVDFDKPAEEWVAQLAESPGAAARIEALQALGALKAKGVEETLGRALRGDPFYGVRRAAAKALAEAGTGEALDALRAGLQDRDPRVRTAVLNSLRAFPEHRELIPELRRTLEGDESWWARQAAARTLGFFREARDEAVPILQRALGQKSFQDMVPSAAVMALAQLGAPQALDAALRLARNGAPAGSRPGGIMALGRIGGQSQDPAVRGKVRQALVAVLDDSSTEVRRDAYAALGLACDPETIAVLERSTREEADGELRDDAADALRRVREAQTTDRPPAAGGAAGDLAGRIEQLEREAEVLRARIEELEKKGPTGVDPR